MNNSQRTSNESQNTRKIRKILHEENRMLLNTNSDSDTEDVDLRKEIHPLSHYINNREEMIEQMFSIIKGTKLRKMLPPTLKDLPLDELKADCLIHLLGMSTKRILAIIEGREINSSSDSETDSDSPTQTKKPIVPKPLVIKQEGCSDISDNSEEVVLINSDFDDILGIESNSKKQSNDCKKSKRSKKLNKKRKDLASCSSIHKLPDKSQLHDEMSCSDDSDIQIESPKKEKTLLEILELEMRARAIRAMLNKDGSEVEKKDASKESQNSLIIDIEDKVSSPENKIQSTSCTVTPAKSYRKSNQKSDDVIIITPKVVTIDLTDEHPSHEKQLEDPESSVPNINVVDKDLGIPPQSGKSISPNSGICVENDDNNKTNETDSETVTNNNKSQAEQKKRSWAQRWLESKEVKKVVSTSKICGNIRKKIKNAKLAKGKMDSRGTCSTPAENIDKMQGSVGEYQLLSKSRPVTIQQSVDLQPSDEQVQDVTSTKNEISLQNNLSGVAMSDDSESPSQLKSHDIELDKCKCDTKQDPANIILCNLCPKDKINSTPENGEMKDQGLESGIPLQTAITDVSEIYILETSNSKSENNTKSRDVDSQTEVDKPESEDNILLVHNISKGASSCVDELETNLSEADTGITVIVDDMVSNITNINVASGDKVKEMVPEPETLEINITEEDREIDGIDDDNMEEDEKNTSSIEREGIEID